MSTNSTTTNGASNVQDNLWASREKFSVAPISYSENVSTAPVNDSSLHKKVTIIGCGQVGMAIAYAILNQEIAGTMALIDMDAEKLDGEAKDLQQGSAFYEHLRIMSSTEYDISSDSDLVIITAGVAQRVGESRLNLVERNVRIMKSIMPKVLLHSPNAAICIVANPCDIMTAVAAKIAGPSVPAGRIFGSGTCLDSSRLRSLIAKSLMLDTSAVSGYVFGEHGDSSVPIWSSVNVGGFPLAENLSAADLQAMHHDVVSSAGDVIKKKGYTNWAVGLTAASIAKAVLRDTREIFPVSTCVRGLYGVKHDVFLSISCSIGAHGMRRVIPIPLHEDEIKGFQKAANSVWEVQKGIWNSV